MSKRIPIETWTKPGYFIYVSTQFKRHLCFDDYLLKRCLETLLTLWSSYNLYSAPNWLYDAIIAVQVEIDRRKENKSLCVN